MITPMSRVEIVCLSSVRSDMVDYLQSHGLLHMEEVPLSVDEAPEFLHRVQLEGEEQATLSRLEDLERTLAEIVPLLSNSPSQEDIARATASLVKMDEADWGETIDGWATPLRDITRRRANLQDLIDVLTNYRQVLEQVAPVLGGTNVKLGKGTRALVLTGNVDPTVERLEERFRLEIGPECTFHKNRQSRKSLVGLLVFPESKGDEISRILSQEGITPVDMRDESYEGATVTEVLSRIDATLDKHRTELAEAQNELQVMSSEFGAQVKGMKSILGDRLSQLRVQGQFAQSQMVTVIHAWTPSDRFDELERVIEEKFPGQAMVTELSHEDLEHVEIPTLLKNPKLFKPFEVILRLFPPPAYGTIDPTIMVAVSFILFYGFIVGDFVYGIAIIGAAKLLGAKLGRIPEVRSASTIGVYMGLSAMFFGILYGEYCGDIFGIPPLWFHRGHDVIQLLIYALYMGIAHMLLSLVLGVRENYRHGHMMHALERLGMLMGLVSLIIGAFAYFDVGIFASPVIIGLAAVLMVTGSGLILKALGPMMGTVGILEIMSLGGNVISYARLMALGVAAIAIADIANTLPESMGIWIGVPMAIMIHLANIFISIASPTIHSLRLNFVEFLPKFYSPEGKGFNPFKKEMMS